MLHATLRAMAALVCLVTVLVLGAAPASAQLPSYGQLFGNGSNGSDSASEPRQSRPQQSRPAASAPVTPTAEDYGRVAESTGAMGLDATQEAVGIFRKRLKATIDRLPRSWREIDTALAAASPTGRPSYFLGVALFAALLITLGRSIGILFAAYVARPVIVAMQREGATGYVGKLPLLATRLGLTAVVVAITLIVATSVGLLFYQEHRATLVTVMIVFAGYGLFMMVDTVWRMALAPYLPKYRLPQIGDGPARALYGWLSSISAFAILTMSFVFWMQAFGLSVEALTALTILLSLLSVLAVLTMFRTHRHTINGIILGGRERQEVSWVTLAAVTLWAPMLSAYLLFTWGDLGFRLIMGIETSPLRLAAPYLIFMGGLIVYAVSAYLIERIFSGKRRVEAMNAALEAQRREEEEALRLRDSIQAATTDSGDHDGDGDEEGGGPRIEEEAPLRPVRTRHSMRTMEDLARRTASLFAIGAVGWALIRFWGGPEIFQTNLLLNLAEDLVDILLIGYIIFHAVRIWIDRRIEEEGGDEDDQIMEGEGGGAGATRLATLLPLFRNLLLIIIAVTVALLIAMKVGVNVAPLFAGAGIVGLAIGFGAQTLVRDILSGAFFLLDDAFRKGEYIDVGEVKGTVEKISLRSFQLRHHLGMLHTIPFGEITHLTNFSRDWVMMKLPLRLTYDTDPEKVRKLVKKLGLSLLEDPEIGHKFLQPLKSQGVIMMDESAMIVRVKFMTQPGEQWVLRKRIFAEIRELFEKEGIKFAHREVTVRIPDLDGTKDISDDQQRAIGAAARRAVDQIDEDVQGPPVAIGDAR